jgi:predicted TIM-barrel fold metal-dependent hydrolase
MTLAEVFRIALGSLGPERILFGSDSGTTAPYREWIAFQQRRILADLGVAESDRDLILRGNAARLFGL